MTVSISLPKQQMFSEPLNVSGGKERLYCQHANYGLHCTCIWTRHVSISV